MLISELFHSIQGEGSLAGVPSVFVRTSGCNLRCVWCDTAYAFSGGEVLPEQCDTLTQREQGWQR